MGIYPAAVQMFPSAIWIKVDNAPTPTLNAGLAAILNPDLGIVLFYRTAPSTMTPEYLPVTSIPTSVDPESPFQGALAPWTYNLQTHIAMLAYGIKRGGTFLGASLNNIFPEGTIVNRRVSTNGQIVDSRALQGFQSAIKPSLIVKIGGLDLFSSLNMNLNFMKYYAYSTYPDRTKKQYEHIVSPSLFNDLSLSVLITKKMNNTLNAGLTLNLGFQDTGYKVTELSNEGKFKSTTNNIDNQVKIGMIFGLSLKPVEKVTLYIDIPFGVTFDPAAHWPSDSPYTYNMTTTWDLPVIRMGGEAEIFKNFKLRLFGRPTWTYAVTKPYANIKAEDFGTGWQDETGTSTYGFTAGVGLGYRIGNLYFNTRIDADWFAEGSLALINLPFAEIQAGYLF